MNPHTQLNNNKIVKVFGALISVAVLSVVVFVTALLRVEPAHAAEPIVFTNVSIENGSMRPLAIALDARVEGGIDDIRSTTSVDADINVGASGTSTAREATTSDTSSNTTSVSIDIENVSTESDLELYARTLEQEDRDISKVEVGNDRIVLAYRQPAKFLGFIPVSVVAHVQVDATGNISIDYPWYTFLSVKEDAELRQELQAQVGTSTVAVSELSARSRAELIQALHKALKKHRSELRAESKATVEVEGN